MNDLKEKPTRKRDKKTKAMPDYLFHTGQEIDLLEQSACDGKSGTNWRTIERYGNGPDSRVYEIEGASHRVEVEPLESEKVSVDALERLTMAQDADFAFAMLYIASILALPAPLEANRFAGGWIDLDDVMEKIGWYPQKRTADERKKLRARIWDYMLYGNRARVVGQRTSTYKDPYTGEIIPTVIASSIWRIMEVERPDTPVEEIGGQMALPGIEETTVTPRRVQIVIGKEWEPLLTAPRLAQYLPMAQLAGEVSPKQVAGDWARCISLALARFWRCYPREVLAGTLFPSRAELLTRYTPKTRTVQELFATDKPGRAIDYYCDALAELRARDLITGPETTRSPQMQLAGLPERKWQEEWLSEKVQIMPGEAMRRHIEERAGALPETWPEKLKEKRKNRRKNPKTGD